MTPPRFDGLLVLDKPLRQTSRAAVNRAQKWFPRGTRLGHTGTLDPLATGVLVLCVGAATRLTEYVQDMPKTYTTTIRLGATSATDDAEGPITPTENAQPLEQHAVEAALPAFLGAIQQVPPAFSAARVSGARAYDLARRGDEVSLAARTVRVDALTLVRYEWPWLDLQVDCGKGTYIRALARDLGAHLGTGGLVQTLRRTRVGPFGADNAVPLDATPEQAQARLLPLREAVPHLPPVVIHTEELVRLRDGRGVSRLALDSHNAEYALVNESGTLLAIGRWEAASGVLLASRILF